MAARRRLAMINSDAKTRPPLPDPDGIQTELYDLRLRRLPRTPYDHLFTELATVAAIEAAVADGCEAVYVDTFGDYGVERARSSVKVPVLGAGEASLIAAARTWGSYSIVTVWPRSMAYLYEQRLAACAGGELCAAVHYVSDEDELDRVGTVAGVKARMLRREDGIIRRLAEQCQHAVERDGSRAILLGCTCMTPVADQVSELLGTPVLDPSRIGHQAALDLMVDETASPPASPEESGMGLATDFVDAYLAAKGLDYEASDECDVCLVSQE